MTTHMHSLPKPEVVDLRWLRPLDEASVRLPEHLLVPYTPVLENALVPSVERVAEEVRELVGSGASEVAR